MANTMISGDTAATAPPAPVQVGAAARRGRDVSVDSRTVLAASGVIMLGYVLLHLAGNLLAFAGSATFNAYARSLRELGSPLVGAGVLLTFGRVVLAGALVAHLAAHIRIMSRPTAAPLAAPYAPMPPAYAAYPLPILRTSGGAILLFVVLHLAQLTFGATVPTFDPADPYHNLVATLRSWPVALTYLAAAAAVGTHLLPAVWTGMRSLRLIRPGTERLARLLAPTIALVAFFGLGAVPIAVATGLVR